MTPLTTEGAIVPVAPFSYTFLSYFLRFFCSTSYKTCLCLPLLRQLPQKYALWCDPPTGEDMEMVFHDLFEHHA